MKNILLLLILSCFVLHLSAQNDGFWESYPGPYGGGIKSLTLTAGDTLYAQGILSNDGYAAYPTRIYRSTDKGQTWQHLSLTLNGLTLNSYISISPNGIFNIIRNEGSSTTCKLYRSFDHGSSWTALSQNKRFYYVAETPGGALMGVTETGIWRSQNGGQSWTSVVTVAYSPSNNAQLTILQNGDLTFSGFSTHEIFRSSNDGLTWAAVKLDSSTDLLGCGVFASTNGTLFLFGKTYMRRSVDNGQSWQTIYVLYTGNFGMVELQDGTLLTVDGDSNLLKSTDDGLNWNIASSNHEMVQIWPFYLSDGTIIGHCNALYRSSNGGATWQFAADSMDLAKVLQLEFKSEDTLFAMTTNGLWRRYEPEQHWTKLNDLRRYYYGTTDAYGYAQRSFALGSNGHLATCTSDSLFWSNDLGDTWQNRTPPTGIYNRAIALGNQDEVLFVNAKTNPQRILRSTDQGLTWQNTNVQNARFIQMEFHPSGRIYATLESNTFTIWQLWQSDDQGINWQATQGIPAALSKVYNIRIDTAGTIWLSGLSSSNEGIICRSTDNGNSWKTGPNFPLLAFGYISGNTLGHLYMDGKYRSVDNGLSWLSVPLSPFDIYDPYIIDPVSPNQRLFCNFRDAGLSRSRKSTVEGAYIDGHVRRDADDDCSTADAQAPLPNWIVEADGTSNSWAVADTNGYYRMFVDTGAYSVQVKTFNDLWWDVCDSVQSVTLNTNLETKTSDFEVVSTAPCALMTVNVNIPVLRRCFNNTVFVSYCNQGAETAENAHIDITLDPFTDFVNAEFPAENLGNNLYRFQLGDVASNDCGVFKFVVNVQCNTTVLGQTHCFEAHAFPDTLCTAVPNWSGAQIEARANCQDTVIQFKLKNVGTAVSQQLDYIIIIDDVVLMQGAKTYNPGEEITITQPTNGQTWRIESQQEPGQPFATENHIALAFKEGCGGYNSLGYINKFPVDEFTPAWDRECVENRGSYDPNDKQGFPTGVGDTKQIGPNQELKYLIRFQNTGSDTAFTVVVRDTLSPWLNPATIRSVSGSHPFTWNLSGAGVLTFTFNHIMLPDSNTNKDGSQGFISFTISQQKDVPLGAEIFNEAAIFFDFNFPVITNRTLHTVGVPLLSGTQTVVKPVEKSALLLAPLPATEYTILRRSDGRSFQNARLVLTDARGQQQSEQRINGEAYRLERRALAAGVYFFRVEGEDGRGVGGGSVVWQ